MSLDAALAQGSLPVDFFKQTDLFLKTYVVDGTVKYQSIQKNKIAIQKLEKSIQNIAPEKLDANTRKAFFVNAYNLLVIVKLQKKMPKSKVTEISDFFTKEDIKIGGKWISLDDLEKTLLFKEFPDPRLHLVLVCGAKGCPPLLNRAYLPATLEPQLEERMRVLCNDTNFIQYDPSMGICGLNMIFQWYEKDFLKSNKSVLEFINRYRINIISAQVKIKFYNYDWRVNGW